MNILVTGADGFVGRALCLALAVDGHRVRRAVRRLAPAASEPTDGLPPPDTALGAVHPQTEAVVVGEIGPCTDWSAALADVNAVVHLAARTHVLHDRAAAPLTAFRALNVGGTERLAIAAATAGVRRLVFVSSIKVNGERTPSDRPLTEADPPAPEDAYGRSKAEAEDALRRIADRTGLEVAIVRPPLVYGPDVKGNLLRLLRLVSSGAPLPFARIDNRRSMIYLGNLVALLARCATHPAAAGELFLAADGEDVSTPTLIRRLANEFGTTARLVPIPRRMLHAAGRIGDVLDRFAPGSLRRVPLRTADIDRLIGSLVVNARKARRLLDYSPPFTMADGLKATADWYQSVDRTEWRVRQVTHGSQRERAIKGRLGIRDIGG